MLDCDKVEHGTFLADCGLNQDPTSEELAAIRRYNGIELQAALIGAKPIIAMLSPFHQGSAHHALVGKVVRKAVEICP